MKPGLVTRTIAVLFALGMSLGSELAHAQLLVDREMVTFMTLPEALPLVSPVVNGQLRFTRVRDAREAAEDEIARMFEERNLKYPATEIFLRVFKLERTLEVWVRSSDDEEFQLLKSYPICALAGMLGPKKQQGDAQVPEGFYYIDRFNPVSSYHLSLGINYPNERDRAANKANKRLGGDIFIHGGCKSEGCLAITDDGIKELYWLALTTRGRGQERIPVHIFPMRLDNARHLARLGADQELAAFWQTLKPGFAFFEQTRRLPDMGVDNDGQYRLNADPGTVARAFTVVAR